MRELHEQPIPTGVDLTLSMYLLIHWSIICGFFECSRQQCRRIFAIPLVFSTHVSFASFLLQQELRDESERSVVISLRKGAFKINKLEGGNLLYVINVLLS